MAAGVTEELVLVVFGELELGPLSLRRMSGKGGAPVTTTTLWRKVVRPIAMKSREGPMLLARD
jgi:hypothetical protein